MDKKIFEVEISSGGPESYKTSAVLTMPCTQAELCDALQKARVQDVKTCRNELTRIRYPGITADMIGRNVDLLELNLLALRLTMLGEDDRMGLDGLLQIEKENHTAPFPLSRLINLTFNADICLLAPQVSNTQELGALLYEGEMLSEEAMALVDTMEEDSSFRERLLELLGEQHQEEHSGVFTSRGYLTKDGIAQIKSNLAGEIFRQDLTELYRQQTQRRDALNQDAQAVMRELILRMEEGAADNPRIGELMTHLADRLRFTSGKKQYGYLKAPLKSVVDEIVDELARDPRVAKAYDLWYEMREEVLRTYKNDLPERLPLSRQKEFKRIKNMVIQEAIRLGELRQVFHPEDQAEDTLPEQKGADGPQPGPESVWDERSNDSGEPHNSWEQIYRRARAILEDPKAPPEQTAQAVELLTKAAEHGSCSAAFTLGRLYLSGTTLPHDPAAAVRWLERAALGGDQHAQYRLGKLLLQGDAVPKDADGAVRWLTASAEQGNQYAQYALGKLFLLGKDVPENRKAARQWFQKAAEQGDQYAQYFVERMDHRDLFPVVQSAARLLHHLAGIFREQSQPPHPRGLRLTVDKKLWRKIREKKIAMGHKPDDHEEPTITM